jgi:predicted acyltransferase
MAGLDFVCLSALIWFVDEHHFSRWLKPFVITGMNAITVYIASELVSELLHATSLHAVLYNKFFVPLGSAPNTSLLWALAFTVLMYFLSYVMYRCGWFIRI